MWSQPNIVALNAQAKASVRTLRKAQKFPRKHNCEGYHYRSSDPKLQEDHRADHAIEWYDIFSDDPKGLIYLCEDAYEDGGWREQYFDCTNCNRLFTTNYTWEMYSTEVDGDIVCIPCALKLYMADDDNWIDPKQIGRVVMRPGAPLVDEDETDERGRPSLNLAATKHVIAVDMPIPDDLVNLGYAEYDSMSGGGIGGDNLHDVMEKAIEEGYDKVLVVLDAAYQFAVSIGVYVRKKAA